MTPTHTEKLRTLILKASEYTIPDGHGYLSDALAILDALPAPAEPTDDEREKAWEDYKKCFMIMDDGTPFEIGNMCSKWAWKYADTIRKALQSRCVGQVDEVTVERLKMDTFLPCNDKDQLIHYLSIKYPQGLRIVKSGERG